jgi:hypothetical protein
LIDQIYVEISLTNNTFPLKIDSSYYHAKNAAELINKTYHLANAISPEDFRVIYEEEQLSNYNSTVQALVIANVADEILRKYGNAYDIDFDLTDMSNMPSNDLENSDYNELILVNIWDYQSAQALATKAQDIFKTELKPIAPEISAAFDINLENGLTQLKNSIKNKASPMDIMMVVHTQIHPNLLEAFNLRLR